MESVSMPNWFSGCRKLLVRAPNWLGDAVMSLPALEAVKLAAPRASLTLALPAHMTELFAAAPDVNEVVPVSRRGAFSAFALAGDWRTVGFDSVLLLPNSFGSALAARLAGIPRRAGYATQLRSMLLTDAVPCDQRRRDLHQVEYYLELIAELGAAHPGFDRARPVRLSAPEAARSRVRTLLAAERRQTQAPLYVLAPCATGPGKEWPAEMFARLASLLWERGGEVALIGAPSEAMKIAAVAEAARSRGAEVIDLSGRNSVAEMAALFESAAGFAGNDSGPMHLAGAMGLAAVGVFVRTDPALYRPLGAHAVALGGPGSCPAPEDVAEKLETLAVRRSSRGDS